MVFLLGFVLCCVVACWWVGDLSLSTKAGFSALYLASWGLFFLPDHRYLFILAQCLLAIIIGGATFGFDWLMQRR
jgi:hypothetical protein